MRSGLRPLKFEEVYQRYEFAPLVELAMGLAAWIRKRLADRPPESTGKGIDGLDQAIS